MFALYDGRVNAPRPSRRATSQGTSAQSVRRRPQGRLATSRAWGPAGRRLGLPGQAEDPLADDVALDLRRAAPDRLGPGEEERRHHRADRVGLAAARGAGWPATSPRPGPAVDSMASAPKMSSASSMASRCISDQNILLVAPSAATPEVLRALHSAAVSAAQAVDAQDLDLRVVRRPGRWRTSGSSSRPRSRAASIMQPQLVLEAAVARWWPTSPARGPAWCWPRPSRC